MDFDPSVERAMLDLIADAEKEYEAEEERHRKELDRITQEVENRRSVLNAYLAKYGRPGRYPEDLARSKLLERFQGATYRQMVHMWADEHDGRVAVKELVDAVLEAGIFGTRQKAHKAMWATVSQGKAKGELARVDEGIYVKRNRLAQPLTLVNAPVNETA